MGVCTAIDDFGVGHSGFGHLKRFAVDVLKIDRTFVSAPTVDSDDAAIARAIVSMAHAFGLRVVAKGVENEAQLELVRRMGCDEAQGRLRRSSQARARRRGSSHARNQRQGHGKRLVPCYAAGYKDAAATVCHTHLKESAHSPTSLRLERLMNVVRFDEAPLYEAPGHSDMVMRRLQGLEAGQTDSVWLGLSEISPNGGTTLSASKSEKLYVVIEGEVEVTAVGGGNIQVEVLKALDSCRILPGEQRKLFNASRAPARILLAMPHQK